MKGLILCSIAAALVMTAGPARCQTLERARISLDGEWGFRLDSHNEGVEKQWPMSSAPIDERVVVPSCWQAQGYGKPTETLAHDYQGAAWYQKEVDVPAGWRGKHIEMLFEGALIHTTAWVNGERVGDIEAFSAPFRFDVTSAIRPGAANRIAVRVSNTEPGGVEEAGGRRAVVGPTGCLNYTGRWGGLYQPVSLEARGAVSVGRVAISTSLAQSTASVSIRLENHTPQPVEGGRAEVEILRSSDGAVVGRARQPVEAQAGAPAEITIAAAVSGVEPWSPEHPNLYAARIRVFDGDRLIDEVRQPFGFREISVFGKQILLNGRPLYLRGYGDDSVYVLEGTPPYERQEWLRRFRLAKSLGFNAVRFHSMTPPQIAFEAADETGMLVAAELPVVTVEHFLPYRELLQNELTRTIETSRNHPSWILFAMGNEFNARRVGGGEKARQMRRTVGEMVELAKRMDPGRLYLSNQGYMVEPSDVASLYQGVAADRPTIKHEYGAYHTSLPDFSLIDRMTGVVRPTWLEAQRKIVEAMGAADRYPAYLRNSWRMLDVSHKAFLEKIRSREDIQGYFYWLITDFPAGTPEGPAWRWGWLNYFWEPKGFSAAEARESNSAIVPLIDRGIGRRMLWSDEPASIGISLSNFSPEAVRDAKLEWQVRSGAAEVASGVLPIGRAPASKVSNIGRITWGPLRAARPQKLDLSVTLHCDLGEFRNHWSFWSFPRVKHTGLGMPVVSLLEERDLERYFPFVKPAGETLEDDDVVVAPTLSAAVIQHVEQGGRALVLANAGTFGSADTYLPQGLGGARGLVVETHRALGDFPHDDFPDLQFYALLEGASAFPLASEWRESVPGQGAAPIVGGLINTRDRRTGTNVLSPVAYLIEFRLGRGKILISTLNLRGRLDDAYPSAIYLLGELLQYVGSNDFDPKQTLSVADAQILSVPYTEMIH